MEDRNSADSDLVLRTVLRFFRVCHAIDFDRFDQGIGSFQMFTIPIVNGWSMRLASRRLMRTGRGSSRSEGVPLSAVVRHMHE